MQSTPIQLTQFAPTVEHSDFTRIEQCKQELGSKLIILAHHYQRADVYKFGDYFGDSLELAKKSSSITQASYIVFCGVHFMAEVADILKTNPEQKVILPDLAAGCSMADMASISNVISAWQQLEQCLPDLENTVTPITYINSAAKIKAFCAEHGGTVCTSSNAAKILTWALGQKQKVFFFPDQHLGRWTGHKLGIAKEKMVVWDYSKPMGGLTIQQLEEAQIILWKGFCSVHQMFRPEHILEFRKKHPNGKVIAHPECCFEVCELADQVGSTSVITNTIRRSSPGEHWLVGTELNLVQRLAAEMKEKQVKVQFMSPFVCMCSTMARIDPQHLLASLENLCNHKIENQITVAEPTASLAKLAIERMLSLS